MRVAAILSLLPALRHTPLAQDGARSAKHEYGLWNKFTEVWHMWLSLSDMWSFAPLSSGGR
jgi:hypothetical protein